MIKEITNESKTLQIVRSETKEQCTWDLDKILQIFKLFKVLSLQMGFAGFTGFLEVYLIPGTLINFQKFKTCQSLVSGNGIFGICGICGSILHITNLDKF